MISACLIGVNCKYSGTNNLSSDVMNILDKYDFLPICPEQLGGLPTPREPSEIFNCSAAEVLDGMGKIVNNKGIDCTEGFIKGGKEILYIAKKFNIKYAILKANSPSCGNQKVYDGSFSGNLILGRGITAELLIRNGIKVYNEKELSKFQREYSVERVN